MQVSRFLPFMDWLLNYRRDNLSGDLIAGVIVTVMLVPQSMAYAQLAGLPPEIGIYASIVPLLIYGLLGSSRVLAVGPVAIVSLIVATSINQLGPENMSQYLQLAITLALLVGIIQLLMGLLRIGFMVNFLSHSVLAGFINAAAIVIALSQLKHLLGVDMPRTEHTHETVAELLRHLGQVNAVTLLIGGISIALLVFFKRNLAGLLKSWKVPDNLILPISRSGPLIVVLFGVLSVTLFDLNASAGVAIVGTVPAGLPDLTTPTFDLGVWQQMLPLALSIALIGYMESISVAKSLASKKRQKVDANQELVAIGSANLGAAFTGAYPVAGGIGRSVVNYSAGANTGLASIITAALMAFTVIFLTPLFYNLPQAVLAAIIVVAVAGLIDLNVFRNTWRYNKADAASLGVTFLAVLFIGVETGILLGVATAIVLYLWRTSQPHYAIVGRIGDTEHFRNVERHPVETYTRVVAVRVDESLYFPNAQYLENILLGVVADNPQVEHVVLVCSAVNYIDMSALEVLEALVDELHDSGVQFCLAEVKGPVMDRLERAGFVEHIGRDNIYMSTHAAVETLCGFGPTNLESA